MLELQQYTAINDQLDMNRSTNMSITIFTCNFIPCILLDLN